MTRTARVPDAVRRHHLQSTLLLTCSGVLTFGGLSTEQQRPALSAVLVVAGLTAVCSLLVLELRFLARDRHR